MPEMECFCHDTQNQASSRNTHACTRQLGYVSPRAVSESTYDKVRLDRDAGSVLHRRIDTNCGSSLFFCNLQNNLCRLLLKDIQCPELEPPNLHSKRRRLFRRLKGLFFLCAYSRVCAGASFSLDFFA
ncbi:hypothetical protein GOP47_0030492 [Adiantum capillus-veneris]|nr:hypothetical protein GOP47_0030492 [Adiantum capillus-veneris]